VWQAPAKYFERYGYAADSTDPREGYHAVMTALDDAIGRIMDQIDRLGLRDNTIVVIASDNGASIRENLVLETGTNSPFRGGRTETYDGGIRTACIVRWPKRLKAGTVCREPIANIDLLPMILNAASVSPPRDLQLDGRDLTATLAGEARSPHDYLFFEFRKWSAARSGRWKIVRSQPDATFELYDLATDWGEIRNVAKENPEIVSRLTRAFEKWRGQFPTEPTR
jgi:arylsulfatase A-like enzyme